VIILKNGYDVLKPYNKGDNKFIILPSFITFFFHTLFSFIFYLTCFSNHINIYIEFYMCTDRDKN